MANTDGPATPDTHNVNSDPPEPTSTSPVQPNHQQHNVHEQFCKIVGIRQDKPPQRGTPEHKAWSKKLYARVNARYKAQRLEYHITASISTTLLLLQIIIGAVLTALGASSSPHIVIAVFGALNTVIAGIITYLKGMGQPMRARAFRDELWNCLDEINDTEAAFLGVAEGATGYGSNISASGVGKDANWNKTVQEEVTRLTALYESAEANARRNAPDFWADGLKTTRVAKDTKLLQGSTGLGDEVAGEEHVTSEVNVAEATTH
jgi:small basic protein